MLRKNYRVHGVEFSLAQRGWSCEIYFACETHRQFTWEWHTVKDGFGNKRWQWLNVGPIGLFAAFINARRTMFAEIKRLRSMGGEFNLAIN